MNTPSCNSSTGRSDISCKEIEKRCLKEAVEIVAPVSIMAATITPTTIVTKVITDTTDTVMATDTITTTGIIMITTTSTTRIVTIRGQVVSLNLHRVARTTKEITIGAMVEMPEMAVASTACINTMSHVAEGTVIIINTTHTDQ